MSWPASVCWDSTEQPTLFLLPEQPNPQELFSLSKLLILFTLSAQLKSNFLLWYYSCGQIQSHIILEKNDWSYCSSFLHLYELHFAFVFRADYCTVTTAQNCHCQVSKRYSAYCEAINLCGFFSFSFQGEQHIYLHCYSQQRGLIHFNFHYENLYWPGGCEGDRNWNRFLCGKCLF